MSEKTNNFKVGDWVKFEHQDAIGTIVQVIRLDYVEVQLAEFQSISVDTIDLRHLKAHELVDMTLKRIALA